MCANRSNSQRIKAEKGCIVSLIFHPGPLNSRLWPRTAVRLRALDLSHSRGPRGQLTVSVSWCCSWIKTPQWCWAVLLWIIVLQNLKRQKQMVHTGIIQQEIPCNLQSSGSFLCLAVTVISSPLFSSFCIISFLFLRYCSRTSQGNQWEPVTVCEQRHYSGDSMCPMRHKNLETAELIESGGVRVSVSSRAEQRRMWLLSLRRCRGSGSAIWPELFSRRGLLTPWEKQNTKGAHYSGAVDCIYMLASLCCGRRLHR